MQGLDPHPVFARERPTPALGAFSHLPPPLPHTAFTLPFNFSSCSWPQSGDQPRPGPGVRGGSPQGRFLWSKGVLKPLQSLLHLEVGLPENQA